MLTEIYFRDETDMKYSPNYIEFSDKLEALLSKLRMILYTNRGEVLGEPELGMDLENYLFEPGLNENIIKERFYAQLAKYIPEHIEYNIDCSISTQTNGVINTSYLYITINNQKFIGLQL